ncbi:MAG: transcription factor FapR [Synergistetes bacterium]|nr:transcription factor FapR [Synergistota bacterium]MCX8127808.1 transcription factor FapR [Synergistota bacterium]MDW8192070.1 transcription factor FapR [Synergistota bacterium]
MKRESYRAIRRLRKIEREKNLRKLVEDNPFLTDEELADILKVSVSTIRFDRARLGIPEVRERMKEMAEKARSALRSMSPEEMTGDLIELKLNERAISVLEATKEMAFKNSDIIREIYTFAQASSLAMALIGSGEVLIGRARVSFKYPVKVGDRIVARGRVAKRKGNKYLISIHSYVDDLEVFVGYFIVVSREKGGEKV